MSAPSLCGRVRAQLSEHLDGVLDSESQRVLRRHLCVCEGCRSEFEALESLSRQVGALVAPATRPGLAHAVRSEGARIESDLQGERRVGWIPWAAAASILLGLAGAYQMGLRSGRGEAWREIALAPKDAGSGAPVGGARDLGREIPDAAPAFLVGTGNRAPVALEGDRSAVRAARSLFADFEVLEAVPEPYRVPLIRSQVHHFGLDRWAAARIGVQRVEGPGAPGSLGDDPLRPLADLVQRLEIELGVEDAVDPSGLLAMDPGPEFWSTMVAAADGPSNASVAAPLDLDHLIERIAPALDGVGRSELGRWVRLKEMIVLGDGDPDGALEALHESMRAHLTEGLGFQSPDFSDLEAEMEWRELPDGTREGVLIRTEGNQRQEYRIRVRGEMSGDGAGGEVRILHSESSSYSESRGGPGSGTSGVNARRRVQRNGFEEDVRLEVEAYRVDPNEDPGGSPPDSNPGSV